MKKILENAQLIKDEIVTFSRTIHQNPELLLQYKGKSKEKHFF